MSGSSRVRHRRRRAGENRGLVAASPPALAGQRLAHKKRSHEVEALSISEGRERLLELGKKVVSDHDQVILTHKTGNVVLISMEEWEAYRETQRLLMDKAALKALLQSFEDHDARKEGRGKSVDEVFSDLI
jgi:antitoxin YefM